MDRKASFKIAAFLVCGAVWAVVVPGAAFAQVVGVTIEADRRFVLYGQEVVLSGAVDPKVQGQQVAIVDETGRTRGTTTTNSNGIYSVAITPRRNTTVHAESGGIPSEEISLKVRPRLGARLRGVRLFGTALVTGVLRPAHDGHRVTVKLFRNRRLVATRKATLRSGRFKAKFYVGKPGTYKARALFSDDDHLRVGRRTGRSSTPLPSLAPGSRSIYVKLLEKRLALLRYHISGIDTRYDQRTADAIRAFNKVQRRARVGSVGESTWRALASPRRPRPRATTPRYHIEVDQTKQVLYRVRGGKVVSILHVSTGAGGATHDGVYRFFRKIYGYSPGRLYYPSYFHGLRAIHGWPEVPTYPASHGCVRVPMWAAKWISSKARIGDQIRIYH